MKRRPEERGPEATPRHRQEGGRYEVTVGCNRYHAGLGLSALALPSADAVPPEVFTIVEHNVTLASEFFPDDICGPRAVTETLPTRCT